MKHLEAQPFWDRVWFMNKTNGKNGKNYMRNERKMEDCPFHTIYIYCCTTGLYGCLLPYWHCCAWCTCVWHEKSIPVFRWIQHPSPRSTATSIRMFLHEHSRMVAGRVDYSKWQTPWPMLRPPWHHQKWIVRTIMPYHIYSRAPCCSTRYLY